MLYKKTSCSLSQILKHAMLFKRIDFRERFTFKDTKLNRTFVTSLYGQVIHWIIGQRHTLHNSMLGQWHQPHYNSSHTNNRIPTTRVSTIVTPHTSFEYALKPPAFFRHRPSIEAIITGHHLPTEWKPDGSFYRHHDTQLYVSLIPRHYGYYTSNEYVARISLLVKPWTMAVCRTFNGCAVYT